MNKVITINLGGTAYQLEEAGYDALRAYLDNASDRLAGNPDRDEIIADIERSIADKFRARLSATKNVVASKEVDAVLVEMGPIEDESAAEAAGTAGRGPEGGTARKPAPEGVPPPKRLYRVHEGAMLAGVCNGIGAYFNVDATLIRLGFVVLTLVWGMGLLVYLVMAFVVPAADSPAERAAAFGAPFTAEELIRRAKRGYYEAVHSFPDRRARREWKRRFKEEMRDCRSKFERELHSNLHEWRHNWHNYWGAAAAPMAVTAVVLPLFSLVQGALMLLWICALVSLLATGALFGAMLPSGLPVWAAIVILFFCYLAVVFPLKAARHAVYRGGAWAPPATYLVDAAVWIAFAAALIWLAAHDLPQIREALHNVPGTIHNGANALRDWWHGAK